jgi:hypothetical protein
MKFQIIIFKLTIEYYQNNNLISNQVIIDQSNSSITGGQSLLTGRLNY